MSVNKNYKFLNVWQSMDAQTGEEVKSLWGRYNLLNPAEAQRRLDQVACIVRNEVGELIGISSVFVSYSNHLSNQFYVYRCFIAPEARVPALDTMLLLKTKEWLQNHNPDNTIKGVLLVVQNPVLKRWNRAVWADTNMTYVGNSPKGEHIRVCYFDNVTI